MYGINHYDLDCELMDKTTGQVIKRFKAREMAAYELNVGNVSGGIASFSQGYSIATMEMQDIEIEPKNHKISVDSQIHAISSVGVSNMRLPWDYRRITRRVEKVVTLE